ncbi:MAG: ABC transporter ATP-binding protein [Burkholderiaceae bacterium]|nr:ABC transporter ATP-binding protein [Burkholderiaceae bacterium]
MSAAPVLQIDGLAKAYAVDGASTPVFGNVSLALAPGEFVALLGESGVGKSTLLNCIAGLDEADAGRILIDGQDLRGLDEPGRARLRRESLGFVFQAFHVLPQLDVAHNVGLPLRLQGRHGPEAEARVQQVLQAVGLAALARRSPAQLSGGQLQRVALARALVHGPRLLLADEPTGNLDPATAERMIELLRDQVREQGCACLLVTHSAAAAAQADRRLHLSSQGMQAEVAQAGLGPPRGGR